MNSSDSSEQPNHLAQDEQGSSDLGITKPSVITERIASIDTLRGLTILGMVFVNDVGPAAPAWTHHIQPFDADGMTFADVIFPAFLFIVGVSIPLAMERAKELGLAFWRRVGHVLSRTLGLLVMGIVQFNLAADISLPKYWWGLLAYIAIILGWVIVPKAEGWKRTTLRILKWIGILGVIGLLLSFQREPVATSALGYGSVEEWTWLQTGWWGILGLIGWAYLVAAVIYMLFGSRREWLMGSMALLIVTDLAYQSGGFFNHVESKEWLGGLRVAVDSVQGCLAWIGQYVDIGNALGAHAAICVAGCTLGTILLRSSEMRCHRERIKWGLVFAAGLFIGGLATDTFAGINKIFATPTWCLWSASAVVLVWVALYCVMDVKKFQAWAIVVRPAGANPLIAYLLHPIIIWIVSIAGISFLTSYKSSESASVAMLGSFGMACVVCGLTAAIARAGIRLRI